MEMGRSGPRWSLGVVCEFLGLLFVEASVSAVCSIGLIEEWRKTGKLLGQDVRQGNTMTDPVSYMFPVED
jgi:hypothetical protein